MLKCLFIILTLIHIAFLNNIAELCMENGYTVEEHQNIETKDGYLLTMQRLPSERNITHYGVNRPPILLMHGLFGSAENFVFLGAKYSLAFLLVEKGYDVWLGNMRSVSYSKHHIKYNPNTDKEYWNFSLQELGTYDLSALIDYILNITKAKDILYIGHSQGCTTMVILCAEKPKYNDKVRLFIALSPAVILQNATHPIINSLLNMQTELQAAFNFFGIYELGKLVNQAFRLCTWPIPPPNILHNMCTTFLFAFLGPDRKEFNESFWNRVGRNIPETIGSKQFFHFLQIIKSGRFQKFDYGSERNEIVYGTKDPPNYKFSNVKLPIALYYSAHDWFVPEKNVEQLASLLPNVVHKYLIPSIDYSHLDFVVAQSNHKKLYPLIIELLAEYT